MDEMMHGDLEAAPNGQAGEPYPTQDDHVPEVHAANGVAGHEVTSSHASPAVTTPNGLHAAPATAPAPREEAGNVDKIRDILFGAQMRDYDRRFGGLEERLLQESAGLRDEVARRLGATEQYVRGELDALSTRLTTEQRERTQGLREAMDALTAVNRDLSERLSNLTEQVAQQHRELRSALAEQQRLLSEEGARRHQELTAALRRESGDLRHAKTDRTALAAMFAELAHRLSNEPDAR